MLITEVNAIGNCRLHTMESFQNRLKALGIQTVPSFAKTGVFEAKYTYFRQATGKDLEAKHARASGAWGLTERIQCRSCGGSGKDVAFQDIAFKCVTCNGRGTVLPKEL